MSWATDFPEELLRKPTGLVGFTGLNIVDNPTHKLIWEAFSLNRKPDRLPLHFRLQDIGYEYPKSKSKRPSYDWYIPKGLLKTGWMKKHLEVIPSLIIFFIDCDWDDPQWKSKLLECVEGINFIKNQFNGRSTKVGLVLIQQNVPLPPGEDNFASERASSLCSLCDLSNKLLFVLPITESLIGYTVRLEHAFVDFSRAYYNSEARKVKSHHDYLNKTTHALLFVRHQFKIAFYNQLKQDSNNALKHYKQAYIYVLELRLLDFNILEIKTIAGFINYKICMLCFMHNMPLDAISQFRKHVDFFKTKLGIPELNFEHTAWMSKQFQIFGDLFDEAIKQGLEAILTQHPGIYYQQAAHHSANRRSLSQATCQGVEGTLSGNFVATLHTLDYYGQRPWRQGQQSIEPPDLSKEKEGIKMLQLVEKQVNHSKIIIPLLGNAVTHAKRYKSPRMKRHLLVQLMQEYCLSNEYSKALSLVARATYEYRNERWWMVLTYILRDALRCAYLSADVQQYVIMSLELLGVYSLISKKEKLRILNNLNLILKGEIPETEPDMRAVGVDKLWKEALYNGGAGGSTADTASESGHEKHKIFTIDVANITPFVECKAQFSSDVFQSDSKISINVFIRSQTVQVVTFDRLSLTLNNETYNRFCSYEHRPGKDELNTDVKEEESLLRLTPGRHNCVTFSFVPLPSDVGSQLEVTSINLEMGSPNPQKDKPSCSFHLVWRGSRVDSTSPSICCQRNLLSVTPSVRKMEEKWNEIKLESYAKISSRKSQIGMDLKWENPSFVGELLFYKLTLKNNEKHAISNVRCNVIFDPNIQPLVKNSTTLYVDAKEEDSKEEHMQQNIIEDSTDSQQYHNLSLDRLNEDEESFHYRDSTTINTNFIGTELDAQQKSRSDKHIDDCNFTSEINDVISASAAHNESLISIDSDTPFKMGTTAPGNDSINNNITDGAVKNISNNDVVDITSETDSHLDVIYQRDNLDTYNGGLKEMYPLMIEMMTPLRKADDISWFFYSRAKHAGDLSLIVSITYDIATGEGADKTVSRCMESRSVCVSVVDPVDVTINLLNLKMDKLSIDKNTPTWVDHCFLLTSTIHNNSHTPIQIINTKLHKNAGVVVDDDEDMESHLRGEELNEAEIATECFCITSNAFQQQSLALGTYTLNLIRKGGIRSAENRKNQIFTKQIELPHVCISSSPLYVDLALPSFGVVHDNLIIFYSIRNMSAGVQDLVVTMETCEGFMFSGHKQVTVRILPLSNIQLKYNLVPLIPGTLSLPKLKIFNHQFPDFQLECHRQTPLPTSIFVKPQAKVSR